MRYVFWEEISPNLNPSLFNIRYELVKNVMNNSLIFTEHCVHPQKPEMEFSLPPPLTDQAQNHLTSPAPSPGLSPQGFSSLHHWQTVDGNAKKGKQKQTNKNFHQLSSLPSIHSLNIISFLNMYKLKYTAHFLSLIS